MTIPVIIYEWSGEALVPLTRFHSVANAALVVGEQYRCETIAERSQASHNHYFAAIFDGWLNLPDALAMDFATAEHLRKHALIMAGFRDERKLVCSSDAEARKVAAFIRPHNEYAIVSVAGDVVVEWTAKSQSMKAMGKAQFQASKQAVLDYIAGMLGVEPDALAEA